MSPALHPPPGHEPALSQTPTLLGHPLDSAEFTLRWPRQLFVQEAQAVSRMDRGHQELLLEEAFYDPLPLECLEQLARYDFDGPVDILGTLISNVQMLPTGRTHRPYYQQRQHLSQDDDEEPTARMLLPVTFINLYTDLQRRGYFVRAFGEDCLNEGPSGISAQGTIGMALGWTPHWPFDPNEFNNDGKLFDIIERLDDLVARPRVRFTHAPDYECDHYVDHAPAIGRALYRWQVNEILDEAEVGLRLADDGDDQGRLVTVSDEIRSGLVRTLLERADPVAGDRVRHAISLFRRREATEEDKRSACIALAGVLEERRTLLKQELTGSDEGALFEIANRFGIRHRRADQSTAYDPFFLDWVFWTYLSTIELTDRLTSRSAPLA